MIHNFPVLVKILPKINLLCKLILQLPLNGFRQMACDSTLINVCRCGLDVTMIVLGCTLAAGM